jgi:TolB-like protein
VDFERSLNFCVAKLRAALRDNAAAPRFIETVPTRGYRFVATCEERGAGRETPWWTVATGLAALLLTGISIYAYRSATQPPKIVVVPFHNETGAPDLDRIAKGVSDAAVARLATPERLPRLLVIGNAAGLQFSFRPRDMKAIGDALGAQYLLLGQLKKDDRQLRVVAHLIRVSDQTHLWAKTYDTATLDLPQQASIAEEIARSVTDRLPGR